LAKFKKDEEKLNNQKLKIEAEININEKDYKKKLKEHYKKYQEAINSASDFNGNITPKKQAKIESQFNGELTNINSKDKYVKSVNELKNIENQLSKNKLKQEEWSSKVDELNLKLAKTQGLDEINDKIGNINNSIKSTVKKVGKWTLAILGVRSAYTAIRSAMGIISQYDENMSANVNYMKFVLANTIKPLIEWIIKAGYSILGFVGRIIYLLTGKNIFQNSGIKDFEKAMKSSSKSAKEIDKSLTGWDSINTLGDNTKDSNNDITLPTQDFDLSNMVKYKTKLEKYISDIIGDWFSLGEEMKNALSNTEAFDQAYGVWSLFMQGIVQLFLGIWEILTGVVELFGGILDIIVGIFTGNFDLIKQGWKAVVNGIINILTGAIDIISGIIKTVIGFIVGLVGEAWQVICGILSIVGSWIYNYIIKPIMAFFASLWDGIISGVKNAVSVVKSVFSSVISFFKNLISTIVNLFRNLGTKVGDVIGGAFKSVINGILGAIENILNFPIKSINKLIDIINEVPGINIRRLSTFSLPRMKTGGIVDVPKRGVNIGGAIAGEAGAEGVLPLTDESTMRRLGQEIAKWIVLNVELNNYIDGRLLCKIIKKIMNGQEFSTNGGI